MIDGQTVLITLASTVFASGVKNAKAPAQFVDDIFAILGAGYLTQLADGRRAQYIVNSNKLVNEIGDKASEIIEENIQIPKDSIILPAVEASRFRLDEDELRTLFANLIASSMDSSKNSIVHESFVSIIGQLSSFDAGILTLINETLSDSHPVLSCARVSCKENEESKLIFHKHSSVTIIPISNIESVQEAYHISSAIDNLSRLGLLEIDFMQWREPEWYGFVDNSIIVSDLKSHYQDPIIDSVKGVISLTTYGRAFVTVCL